MGNQQSSSSKRRGSRKSQSTAEQAAERAKRVVDDLQEGIKKSVKNLDEDHPAAQLLDHVCGTYYHEDRYRNSRSASYYSEDHSEDGSRTFQSEDDTTYDGRRGRRSDKSVDSQSYYTQSDYDSDSRRRGQGSYDTEDESRVTYETEPKLISKPLASSFAKRCYFTKAGIGKTTQHYEGLTLTGNVVLMLASAMKLKGCPTICDEDLRRVEQTYPNQFSRLPDELLLSSGWRRISKYCHFSNKAIPDGIPFFHSKQRLHPSGGFYFLLAASVGMIRPIDVEPLTKDTLVLLETDFPNQCDAAPGVLITDPAQWVLVNKFCFFSGGPINTEEDVYYQADFDGNPIFMLAFLSPSLTPEELYKLTENGPEDEPGLKSVADVQEVESVYDLTERDFDDLKLYHLGPCRALPQYILQPSAWTKVLPPHFLAARQQAMLRAQDYDERFDAEAETILSTDIPADEPSPFVEDQSDLANTEFFRDEAEEEGAFHNSTPVNESGVIASQIDPPDDEPPSLKIGSMEENESPQLNSSPSNNVDDQGFLRLEPEPQDGTYVSATESEMVDQEDYSDEKKDEIDPEEQTKSMSAPANKTHNDVDPIETLNGDEEEPSPHGVSPVGRQSPAMRGAHEILKRRRAEANSHSNRSFLRKGENAATSAENLESTGPEMSTNEWNENGTDVAGSAVSGSSIVSDNSAASDRNSRRALILQMAKARMKNNRESPARNPAPIITEDEADETVFTEANGTIATHDFDLTGDLD